MSHRSVNNLLSVNRSLTMIIIRGYPATTKSMSMTLLKRFLLSTPQLTANNASIHTGSLASVTGTRRHWSSMAAGNFIFRQMFDNVSSTYTYLLADAAAKEAILIDPVIEHAKRDFQLVTDLKLKLKYAINTHMHADHITGTGELKSLSKCKSIISAASGALADIFITEEDTVDFGRYKMRVLATPGHTNGCITYYLREEGLAFTGDTVLIRGCGRTDFQEGSAKTLYNSVHKKIFNLPKETKLYPAHDYNGMTSTTVDEEQRLNPRLTKSLTEFIDIMDNLKLQYPKMIDKAVPANKVCGLYELMENSGRQ